MIRATEVAKKRIVTLEGLKSIMFDRYIGGDNRLMSVLDKCYTDSEGYLVLPSLNIVSFLLSQTSEGPLSREEEFAAALSSVTIDPDFVYFMRHGKKILVNDDNLKIHCSVARAKKGNMVVSNPKERPYLELPWSLTFSIAFTESTELNEALLKKLFDKGGMMIGLGTFRGPFGKFRVSKWS